jgi:hypothetical protein
MLKRYITLIFLLFCSSTWAFELLVIQGISRSGQTFITRVGKKNGVFVGKRSTFTAENVSIIAKAISVTREFTQWEIENNFTEVPFRKGQIVTFYNTTEYLWALAPESVKAKLIKSNLWAPRKSVAVHSSLIRGVSESVSGVDSETVERGGLQLELYLESEVNRNFAMGYGIRYTSEVINIGEASISTTRLLGVLEARYYFNPIKFFFNARPSFGLGAAYGQSFTDATGLTSAGTAMILPITKLGFHLPISKITEFSFETAFESLQVSEKFETGEKQVTNVNNFKLGIAIKRFF